MNVPSFVHIHIYYYYVLISIILVTMCKMYFYSMAINAAYLSYYCTSPYSMCTYVRTYNISESTVVLSMNVGMVVVVCIQCHNYMYIYVILSLLFICGLY